MVALLPTSGIASFLFIILFSVTRKLKQGFFVPSAQAQGIEVEDSLCVELNKVKLEVILKVEAHRTFMLY
jgi:hypothetical protein